MEVLKHTSFKMKDIFTIEELAKISFTDNDFINVLLPKNQKFTLKDSHGLPMEMVKVNKRFTKALIIFFQYLKVANWDKNFIIVPLDIGPPYFGMGFIIKEGMKFPAKFYHMATNADLFVNRFGIDIIVSKIKYFNEDLFKG